MTLTPLPTRKRSTIALGRLDRANTQPIHSNSRRSSNDVHPRSKRTCRLSGHLHASHKPTRNDSPHNRNTDLNHY